MKRILSILAVVLAMAASAQGQSWSGILSSSRAVDWTQSGLPSVLPDGEVPANRWTPPIRPPCTSSDAGVTVPVAAGITMTALETAMANCNAAHPAGSYLMLAAGTFSFSSGRLTMWGSPYLTLRGSGPQSTDIDISGSAQLQFGDANGAGSGNWVGAAAGTTSLPLTGVTGITPTVGNLVVIQQNNLVTDNGGLWICDGATNHGCAQQFTVSSKQTQIARITSVSGSGSSYTIGIDPAIIAPNWSSTFSPVVSWQDPSHIAYGVAFEDMTISGTTSANSIFDGGMSYASWFKGVRILGSGAFISTIMANTLHNLYMNNYGFDNPSLTAQFPPLMQWANNTDGLVINNINASSVLWEGEGGNERNGVVYNYGRDTFTQYMEDLFFDHSGGSLFTLFEGNKVASLLRDNTFATSPLQTTFRNVFTGWLDPYVTVGACCFSIASDAFSRFGSDIGNALGNSAGFVNGYQSVIGSPVTEPIYRYNNNSPTDVLTQTSSLRWGNCDTSTNTCRNQSSEIPTTLTGAAAAYNNFIPGSTNLPCSFFMSIYPLTTCTPRTSGGTGINFYKVCTTWATFPTSCSASTIPNFPIAGPDISGGAYVNGHGVDNPAAVAFKYLPVDPAFQNSYTIASSSWAGGVETLTFSGGVLPDVTHLMGPFQVSGLNSACTTGAFWNPNNELLMVASSATTVQYALAGNPGVSCTGTFKFPDIRKFDEAVYQNDPAGNPPVPPAVIMMVGNSSPKGKVSLR